MGKPRRPQTRSLTSLTKVFYATESPCQVEVSERVIATHHKGRRTSAQHRGVQTIYCYKVTGALGGTIPRMRKLWPFRRSATVRLNFGAQQRFFWWSKKQLILFRCWLMCKWPNWGNGRHNERMLLWKCCLMSAFYFFSKTRYSTCAIELWTISKFRERLPSSDVQRLSSRKFHLRS